MVVDSVADHRGVRPIDGVRHRVDCYLSVVLAVNLMKDGEDGRTHMGQAGSYSRVYLFLRPTEQLLLSRAPSREDLDGPLSVLVGHQERRRAGCSARLDGDSRREIGRLNTYQFNIVFEGAKERLNSVCAHSMVDETI